MAFEYAFAIILLILALTMVTSLLLAISDRAVDRALQKAVEYQADGAMSNLMAFLSEQGNRFSISRERVNEMLSTNPRVFARILGLDNRTNGFRVVITPVFNTRVNAGHEDLSDTVYVTVKLLVGRIRVRYDLDGFDVTTAVNGTLLSSIRKTPIPAANVSVYYNLTAYNVVASCLFGLVRIELTPKNYTGVLHNLTLAHGFFTTSFRDWVEKALKRWLEDSIEEAANEYWVRWMIFCMFRHTVEADLSFKYHVVCNFNGMKTILVKEDVVGGKAYAVKSTWWPPVPPFADVEKTPLPTVYPPDAEPLTVDYGTGVPGPGAVVRYTPAECDGFSYLVKLYVWRVAR